MQAEHTIQRLQEENFLRQVYVSSGDPHLVYPASDNGNSTHAWDGTRTLPVVGGEDISYLSHNTTGADPDRLVPWDGAADDEGAAETWGSLGGPEAYIIQQ